MAAFSTDDLNASVQVLFESIKNESARIQILLPSRSVDVINTILENYRGIATNRFQYALSEVLKSGPESSRGARNPKRNVGCSTPQKFKASQDFKELCKMFPNIDKSYIEGICESGTFNYESNFTKRLNIMAEHILLSQKLDESRSKVTTLKRKAIPKDELIEERFNVLIGIFPDADPSYLRIFLKDNFDNESAMERFIDKNLKNPKYKTGAQVREENNIRDEMKIYIDFDVIQFLEILPDPFKTFEDKNRKCIQKSEALKFLKEFFPRAPEALVWQEYQVHNYNISLTAKKLRDAKYKQNAKMKPVTTKDISLLQEITYLKNRSMIKDIILSRQMEEKREFKKLKKCRALLECNCCFNEECLPWKCSQCEAGHIFCYNCITKGAGVAIGASQTRVKCFVDCEKEIPLNVLQNILLPKTFNILLQKRQEEEVKAAGLKGLISCPFCYFAMILPAEDKIFKCLNPECMKESCRTCRELEHLPYACNEAKEKGRLYLEEKLTRTVIINCYKCKVPFVKKGGCNKMTCSCGAMMCYICQQPVYDYKHFQNNKTCVLYMDDKQYNAARFKKAEEEAKRYLKTNASSSVR